VGALIKDMLEDQFLRLRDGDRLFYRGDAAGLYADGIPLPEIAAIIDLENLRLADVIRWNTQITRPQQNVFFAAVPEPSSVVAFLAAANRLAFVRFHRNRQVGS
jgi:hypothetical protein